MSLVVRGRELLRRYPLRGAAAASSAATIGHAVTKELMRQTKKGVKRAGKAGKNYIQRKITSYRNSKKKRPYKFVGRNGRGGRVDQQTAEMTETHWNRGRGLKQKRWINRCLKAAGKEIFYENGESVVSTAATGYQAKSYKALWDSNTLQRLKLTYNNNFTDKTYLTRSKYTVELTNFTNVPVRMTLYYIYPKHDMAVFTDTDQNNAQWCNPLSAWEQGEANEGAGMGIAQWSDKIEDTPFKSRAFVKNYKVKSVKEVDLAPGANHKVNVYLKGTRLLDEYRFRSLRSTGYGDSPAACLKGITCWVMWVAKAGVVKITGGPSEGHISTGRVEIGEVWTGQHELRQITPSITEIHYMSDVIPHETNNANISLINEDEATVVTQVEV